VEIHISRGGEKFGPYSFQQTQDYLRQGSLLSDDLAWHEGIEDWVALSELMSSTEAAIPQELVKGEEKAKTAPKKIGILKMIIYGVPIFFILIFAFVRFWPPPQVDVDELKSFISKKYSKTYSERYGPGIVVNSMELKVVEESHEGDRGQTDYDCVLKITKPDGSKGKIAGTVAASYGLIWEDYWDAYIAGSRGPLMGRRFRVNLKLEEVMTMERIEAETRKALRHKLDSNPETKGAVIESLSLRQQEGNKYTGTVEITDPDGSKVKLNLHVTDHDGKIFFETKP